MAPVNAPVCGVVPGVSRRFIWLMLAVHGTAALVPWVLGLQPALAAALSAGVLGWGGWHIATHRSGRGRNRVASVELAADGRARLHMGDGHAPNATLRGVPLTNRMMTLLVFRTEARQRLVTVVWSDACAPGDYRRLRVYVRWAGWYQGAERSSRRPDAPA